jgi:chemotaxis protein CheC
MISQEEESTSEEYEQTAFPDTRQTNEQLDLGIILELGSIGAGHAATSLSQVVQEPVTIDVPKIHSFPLHLLPKYYSRHDEPVNAVYMSLADSECDILLVFEVEEAKKIAAIMTMTSETDNLDPLIEQSAIQELANILIGSFLTAISDFTGVQLLPTAPESVVDKFDAIIDYFLIKQSILSNEALIFDANFKRSGTKATSTLIIFPNQQLRDLLIKQSEKLI